MREHKILCDVCGNEIVDRNTATLWADDFPRYLRLLYEEAYEEVHGELDDGDEYPLNDEEAIQTLLSGPVGKFADQLGRCIYVQFEHKLESGPDGALDIRDAVSQMKERFDHSSRIMRVLEGVPESKDVYLVMHDDCIPERYPEGFLYGIDLTRIDTGAKGVEWTLQMSEKMQWNPRGWAFALRNLFGRIRA